jgi:hemerythrin-like metal-binding protein
MKLKPHDPTQPIDFHPSLRLGVPAIDRQHASLIAALNRLIADEHAGPGSVLFSDVLTQLGHELDEHFRLEEFHFTRLGLPGAEVEAHVAAHGEILSQYAHLNLDLMHPHGHSRQGLLILLRSWIVEHIESFDLGLRRYLPA